ncbi:porin [Bradyrhizobium sp. U87765 SZCCT0131]|uniref:porin n=1 Tax=unclassified Bradyrhizobium TaxID=2631580 RepID=UPI001BAA458C|nr:MULTISPECIES: porin [unclassified Bradyrhizobium]MBR1222164.1 porin [Bradyrhizobium sp. U87765 SZCCT0131]MBR1265707.1 porin [Bradyrhizobium sp. U87765 SZCCT0134]MBR1307865.1 porin [Bradyrhizobium sp. U87765 SZCCT0110]MBR1324025.1 porin [Bradyrhizobium sp. U87765 SZCCT0109]MBR1348285.1 porin [Bradyrhizobium sp. U87765 SZCCT0048]
MTTMKTIALGSAAALLALPSAHAADLPVKAKAVEYVKVCSLYGAGFYYIPGTDTCMRIGGAMRIETAFNGQTFNAPYFGGGPGGANAYGRGYFNTRERLNLFMDTRTATDYGTVRTYANLQFDFLQGRESIAGGYVALDYAFLQFAGFTFGKGVSMFDPQWTLAKPLFGSTGFFNGSNDATGIPMLAYTATFGGGVSATVSLEDAQPYRSAGTVNTSLGGTNALLGPFGAASSTYGVAANTFQGNAQGGDHVPDIVANLRLEQAWGTAHLGAAAHEVHGTSYNPLDASTGHPDATWGYALTAALELKDLPTGRGDSFKAIATFANGAAKYVFGGTYDSAGAGRLANIGNGGMAFGYVLDGIYANGTSFVKSDAWNVAAFYEHYWTPAWRTSLFASYSHISYGAAGDALLLAMANAGRLSTGKTTATGSFDVGVAQVGTRTAWTPVQNLTLSAEFLYTRLQQHLNGTFTSAAAGTPPGYAAGSVLTLKDQNLYVGSVQILRSF